MFDSIDTSASGLTAQRLRMDVISENIANVNTTRTADGDPYRRKVPVFRTRGSDDFSSIYKSKLTGEEKEKGVEVTGVEEDDSPFKMVYRPNHPDANEDGYLALPNVNVTTEMVDMIGASRSYEANVTALQTSKSMAMNALQIGRG